MASPGQRIQQSYVSGAGASGGLVAGAMIGFICLVGLVSFSSWPQPSGSPASPADLSLPVARAVPPAEPHPALAPTASQATAGVPTRTVQTSVAAGAHARPGTGGTGRGSSDKGSSRAGDRVHVTTVPPTRVGATTETGSAPGNSGNAPGHTKRTDSRAASDVQGQGQGNGHANGQGNSEGHGNGRGNGHSRDNEHGRGNGHGHGDGPHSD